MDSLLFTTCERLIHLLQSKSLMARKRVCTPTLVKMRNC